MADRKPFKASCASSTTPSKSFHRKSLGMGDDVNWTSPSIGLGDFDNASFSEHENLETESNNHIESACKLLKTLKEWKMKKKFDASDSTMAKIEAAALAAVEEVNSLVNDVVGGWGTEGNACRGLDEDENDVESVARSEIEILVRNRVMHEDIRPLIKGTVGSWEAEENARTGLGEDEDDVEKRGFNEDGNDVGRAGSKTAVVENVETLAKAVVKNPESNAVEETLMMDVSDEVKNLNEKTVNVKQHQSPTEIISQARMQQLPTTPGAVAFVTTLQSPPRSEKIKTIWASPEEQAVEVDELMESTTESTTESTMQSTTELAMVSTTSTSSMESPMPPTPFVMHIDTPYLHQDTPAMTFPPVPHKDTPTPHKDTPQLENHPTWKLEQRADTPIFSMATTSYQDTPRIADADATKKRTALQPIDSNVMTSPVRNKKTPRTNSTRKRSKVEDDDEYDVCMLVLANDTLVNQLAESESRRVLDCSRLKQERDDLKIEMKRQEARFALQVQRLQVSMQAGLMASMDKITQLNGQLEQARVTIERLQPAAAATNTTKAATGRRRKN